jgi:hypothetical protein
MDGFARFQNGRAFEADISGRRQFEARRASRRRRAEQLAQFGDIELFGDIVEQQGVDTLPV